MSGHFESISYLATIFGYFESISQIAKGYLNLVSFLNLSDRPKFFESFKRYFGQDEKKRKENKKSH